MNYPKVASYEAKNGEVDKAMLLFSGGLDSSVVIRWLKEVYNCDVVTLTVDLGQFSDSAEKKHIKEKALKLGAADALVIDVRDNFVNQYVAKSILANGCYRGKYYLSTPLGRPLIAKLAAELAPKYGCQAVVHGCTGKGNDQVRLDAGVRACNPALKIIAPVREWKMGRNDEIEYAKKHGIEVPVTKNKSYSHDTNLWGNTTEGSEIEFPEKSPDYDKLLQWCIPPEKASDNPQILYIGFNEGIPYSIDGKEMPLIELIKELNSIGAAHGVGIATVIEDRIVGMKSRGVYEAPAAEIIITAHTELEKLILTHDQLQFKAGIDWQWAWMCYHARWYDPLMDNLNAYLLSANEYITGKVTMKLYKGVCTAISVESPYSLFSQNDASFDNMTEGFNVNASAPFIEHYSAWQWRAQRVQKMEKSDEKVMGLWESEKNSRSANLEIPCGK
jgi:argininosuccinate synthase